MQSFPEHHIADFTEEELFVSLNNGGQGSGNMNSMNSNNMNGGNMNSMNGNSMNGMSSKGLNGMSSGLNGMNSGLNGNGNNVNNMSGMNGESLFQVDTWIFEPCYLVYSEKMEESHRATEKLTEQIDNRYNCMAEGHHNLEMIVSLLC